MAVILMLTAAAKVKSAFGTSKLLLLKDPILVVSDGRLLVASAAVEFLVVVYLLFGKRSELKALLVMWLATIFLTYRTWLHYLSPSKPCKCLGSITDWLRLSTATANKLLLVVTLIMLCGGGAILIYRMLSRNGHLSSRPTAP